MCQRQAGAIPGVDDTERQGDMVMESIDNAIIEEAPVGYFQSTVDGKLLKANCALARMFGFDSPEEMVAVTQKRPVQELLYQAPDSRQELVGEALDSSGEWLKVENDYVTKQGEPFAARLSLRALAKPQKGGFRLEGFIEDISRQKDVETVLERTRYLQSAVFESLATALCVVRADGVIENVNPEFARLTGYRRSDIEQNLRVEQILPTWTEGQAQGEQSGEESFSSVSEHSLMTRRGDQRTVTIKTAPVRQSTSTVLSLSDVTPLREREQRILQLNRMLQAVRGVNELIVRERDQKRLLEQVCAILVESRGFTSAWAVHVDDSGKVLHFGHAGFSHSFEAMRQRLETGLFPNCFHETLKSRGILVIDSLDDHCRECPVRHLHGNVKLMTMAIRHKERLFGVINVALPGDFVITPEERSLFEEMVGDLAFAFYNREIEEQHGRAEKRIADLSWSAITTLSQVVESRDPYISGHQQRVADLAVTVAEEMALSPETLETLRVAGLLHDIGKMRVPAEILSRPGKLSESEFALIREHPETGYAILQGIRFSWPVADIVLQHHERIDGSGYPHGLKGREIRLEAKILAVADVVEAMTSHRPYRPGLGLGAAIEEILHKKSTHFDEDVVQACVTVLEQNPDFIQTKSW
ncbi:MAG: HD domain-containing protein [Synergistales bacterium]|nr:HD domain-containing protein [Synergistales bacterium]